MVPDVAESITALTARRASAHVADQGVVSDIVACGVVPWRISSHGVLEVLLIHRPEYEDWSWPKGKLDDGETLPECAVRETREEIGLNVTLGIPLPVTHYTVPSRKDPSVTLTKEVWYWAAQVSRQSPQADGQEVDRFIWLPATEARKKLTNEGDRAPVDALMDAHADHRLHTRPLLILRHAKAKPRSSWSRAESERPLAATGKRQAWAIKKLLEAWQPRRVISSPWIRCMQTVTPYAQQVKRSIKQLSSLTEKKANKKPKKAAADIEHQLHEEKSAVVCTHRPVLPIVVEVISKYIIKHTKPEDLRSRLVHELPDSNPYLKPGSVLVAQQAVGNRHQIVSVEIYGSYDL